MKDLFFLSTRHWRTGCDFLAAPGGSYVGSLSGRKPSQGQSPPRPSHSLSLHCPLLECRGQGLPTILLQALSYSLGTCQVPKDRSPGGLKLPFQYQSMLYSPRCSSIPPGQIPVLLMRNLGLGIIKGPAKELRLELKLRFHLVGTSSVKGLPVFSVAQFPVEGL